MLHRTRRSIVGVSREYVVSGCAFHFRCQSVQDSIAPSSEIRSEADKMTSMGWFTTSPEKRRKRFWKWFVRNQSAIHGLSGPDDPFILTIGKQLQKVHRGLMWEVSSPDEDGVLDFVISADGLPELVEEVESLADAAPQLTSIRVVRFRAPHSDIHGLTLGIGEIELSADDLRFTWRPGASGMIDVLLLVPPMPGLEPPEIYHAAFLMLDAILGEYNVMCRIGKVDVLEANEEQLRESDSQPIAHLREMLNK